MTVLLLAWPPVALAVAVVIGRVLRARDRQRPQEPPQLRLVTSTDQRVA